jgi:drug/metabolite transporter (DMT)-like permease
MTLDTLPLVLVLLSALMHAGWNFIAKLGDDRLVAMAIMKVPNLLVALAIIAFVGLPAPESWPYLLASWVVNCTYFYFLIRAYHGDLSLAYPVARGSAPLLVLVLSAVAAREIPTPLGIAGVLLISIGIFALAMRRDATKQHYATLLWAGGVGLAIALYTVIDGLGGRRSGNTVGYVAVLSSLTAIAVCGTAFAKRGRAVTAALRLHWKHGLAGGTLMLLAYMIVVYAMTLAPMAQIAALRESSVIFAAILGVIVLKEPFGVRRVIASTAVAAGIALLALGR